MNHVGRVVGHPDLGLPCDIGRKACKCPLVRECRYVNYVGGCRSKQCLQLDVTLGINGTMGRDGLDKHKPVFSFVPEHDIRHLAMFLNV